MYGTVARMIVKAGMESQFADVCREACVGTAPGQIGVYVYQMDSDSREFFFAVMFESKEAYHANSASPEQGARFAKIFAALDANPEWHDGEIVYSVHHPK